MEYSTRTEMSETFQQAVGTEPEAKALSSVERATSDSSSTAPDLQKYMHHVDQFDLSPEKKADLIRTVWTILESFVDRAFGVHPVQQSCGKQEGDSIPGSTDVSDSSHPKDRQKIKSAAESPALERRSP